MRFSRIGDFAIAVIISGLLVGCGDASVPVTQPPSTSQVTATPNPATVAALFGFGSVPPKTVITPTTPTPVATFISAARANNPIEITPPPPLPSPTPDPKALGNLPKYEGLPVLPLFTPVSAYSIYQSAGSPKPLENSKLKVGIQAGHWLVERHPDELADFRKNGGTQGGGVREVDLNLDMARRIATILQGQGILVEILPATVPVNYTADVFVALHADGNTNPTLRGYKIARSKFSLQPATDDALVEAIYQAYGAVSEMPRDENHISRNMLEYFAFYNRRYQHALSPRTPAAIVEMGYLTNETDRKILTGKSEQLAQALASAIQNFLKSQPRDSQRETLNTPKHLETYQEYTKIYSSTGQPVAWVGKGQHFDWFEEREGGYYMVDIPGFRKGVMLKKNEVNLI